MLLRSSSTPVLGSLLTSFSDSPNNNSTTHHDANKLHPIHHQTLNKVPYHHHHQTADLNLNTVSCNSSPITPSIADSSDRSHNGFRRAQSDGNLQDLAYASSNNNSNGKHRNSGQPKKFSGRTRCLVLETIPSFSLRNLRGPRGQNDDNDDDESEIAAADEREQVEENDHFASTSKIANKVLSEDLALTDTGFEEERGFIREEMYLARGLGIDYGPNGTGGGGGGGDFNSAEGDGEDMHGSEEYYKRMVQENPGSPLFLRNYAHFLYQSKQDLQGAEYYFSRAILADPKDGDILAQYAKLVWELHHDQDRALSYFERAVQASPEDSHVHAAFASFLWETEEDEDECSVPRDFDVGSSPFQEGATASVEA